MKRVLSSLTLAIMQTEADAERLRALGMNADKTLVSGSLKFDAGTMPTTDALTAQFRGRFKIANEAPMILAASTHDPEEVIILNSLRQVLSGAEVKPRLMIAPRHPERFTEVAEFVKASGLRWTRRTSAPDPRDGQVDVILLDSIGELHSVYSLASIVFVGGSIANTGGHNLLEPAAVGVPVIVGAHTYNFQSIVETFVNAGAIVQLQPMSNSAAIVTLSKLISELLADPTRRRELGTSAQSLVKENRGATERTLKLLGPILAKPTSTVNGVAPLRTNGAPTA